VVSEWHVSADLAAAALYGSLALFLFVAVHFSLFCCPIAGPFSGERIRFISRVSAVGPGWIELERPLPYDLRLEWQVSAVAGVPAQLPSSLLPQPQLMLPMLLRCELCRWLCTHLSTKCSTWATRNSPWSLNGVSTVCGRRQTTTKGKGCSMPRIC
jgi:hypothetical protein